MKRRQFVTDCENVKPLQIVTVWVAVLLVLLLAVGCCPCRHLTASSSADSVHVETHIRTEYMRDTLFIEVPSETTTQTVAADSSRLETKYAISDARIESDGRLFHSLRNKPQNAPVAVETPIIYRDSIVYRDRTVNSIVEVARPLTAWQRFQMSGFWAFIAALASYIVINIKKYAQWKK